MDNERNRHTKWWIMIVYITVLTILIQNETMQSKTRIAEQVQDQEQHPFESIWVEVPALETFHKVSVTPDQENTATITETDTETESNPDDDTDTSKIVKEVKAVPLQAERPITVEPSANEEQPETAKTDETDHIVQTMASKYRAVKVTATGYSPGRESTGKDPGHPQYGITYSGLKVKRDRDSVSTIAADLNVFPLGTVLYIPGYGYGVVADIGSAIKGHIIDLFFDTEEDVYKEWGKKTLDVYVIEEGTGKITQEMFEEKMNKYKS